MNDHCYLCLDHINEGPLPLCCECYDQLKAMSVDKRMAISLHVADVMSRCKQAESTAKVAEIIEDSINRAQMYRFN